MVHLSRKLSRSPIWGIQGDEETEDYEIFPKKGFTFSENEIT